MISSGHPRLSRTQLGLCILLLLLCFLQKSRHLPNSSNVDDVPLGHIEGEDGHENVGSDVLYGNSNNPAGMFHSYGFGPANTAPGEDVASPAQHPGRHAIGPQPPNQMDHLSGAHGVPTKKVKVLRAIATGAELLSKTAGDLIAGDQVATFVCPLKSCAMELPEFDMLTSLWSHCGTEDHAEALYAQDHYRCEMGCELGFADTGHRLDHYANAKCYDGELSSTRCHRRRIRPTRYIWTVPMPNAGLP